MAKHSRFAALILAVPLSACGLITDWSEHDDGLGAGKKHGRENKLPKLNLSHIQCSEGGGVLAHFVLLFAGGDVPGKLTGVASSGSFGPTAPEKHSGNVWHYNVTLSSGEIEIQSATVTTAAGVIVALHNPGEYTGNYQCGALENPPAEGGGDPPDGGGEDPPAEDESCPVAVAAQDVFCGEPFGNPGEECGAFGLLVLGKDDGLSGTSVVARQNADVALVKSGSNGCEDGQTSYRVHVGVQAGDTLSTPFDQSISHVTYCACPEP
jgi:hypothetical protein